MNWSRGELEATRTAAELPDLRPARPALCQVEAMVPGISGQDGDVQGPDVDPQLEGVRRDDAQDLALAQALLDLAPLEGQVAAAVAADQAFVLDRPLDVLLEVGEEDLGDQAALGEDDGLEAVPQEERGHPARFVDVGTPDAQGLVDDGRRVEDEVLLAPRGAVVVDESHRGLDHLLGHFDGIGDGRRAQDELRVGAVEMRRSA